MSKLLWKKKWLAEKESNWDRTNNDPASNPLNSWPVNDKSSSSSSNIDPASQRLKEEDDTHQFHQTQEGLSENIEEEEDKKPVVVLGNGFNFGGQFYVPPNDDDDDDIQVVYQSFQSPNQSILRIPPPEQQQQQLQEQQQQPGAVAHGVVRPRFGGPRKPKALGKNLLNQQQQQSSVPIKTLLGLWRRNLSRLKNPSPSTIIMGNHHPYLTPTLAAAASTSCIYSCKRKNAYGHSYPSLEDIDRRWVESLLKTQKGANKIFVRYFILRTKKYHASVLAEQTLISWKSGNVPNSLEPYIKKIFGPYWFAFFPEEKAPLFSEPQVWIPTLFKKRINEKGTNREIYPELPWGARKEQVVYILSVLMKSPGDPRVRYRNMMQTWSIILFEKMYLVQKFISLPEDAREWIRQNYDKFFETYNLKK